MKSAGKKYNNSPCKAVPEERISYPELYIDSGICPKLTGKTVDDDIILVAKAKIVGMRQRRGGKANYTLEIRNIGTV